MEFYKPNTTYWDDKLAAYLHDPIDKVFDIRGHEERAAKLLEALGLSKPNEKFWVLADCIAAGFERGQVPSHSHDKYKDGSIEFWSRPILTHPTSQRGQVQLDMGFLPVSNPREVHEELLAYLNREISSYSDSFSQSLEQFASARFFFTHLVLRFKLAHDNVAGLGCLWHRLPADSRFPDHSIWQHNALTSALYSCMDLEGNPSNIGMMVFSITPVQTFIATARKLRDYWTGSVLLSWLAFEGIKWVMENLGPDHILYPSLVDQPLVNRYLEKHWKTGRFSFYNKATNIASFPNKFLFLIPMKYAHSIGEAIIETIKGKWKELCDGVINCVFDTIGKTEDHIRDLFNRQNSSFWNFDWCASKLIDKSDRNELLKLFEEKRFEPQWRVLEIFDQLVKETTGYENDGRGILYSASHSLAQSALAAQKVRKKIGRQPEPGEKCHLCGEFEVLHHRKHEEGDSARKYKKNITEFWTNLNNKWKAKFDFEDNERLCSICLTKRIAYRVLAADDKHILHETFKGMEFYPSTTELALYNYFLRENIQDPQRRHEIAKSYHDEPDDMTDNRDNYYAILLMDGDKMGDLVCGKNLASTWKSVMHPDLVKRIEEPQFDKRFKDAWANIFSHHGKRLLTPAIHAAISEALTDFSIYGVAPIVSRHGGKLIYAGGDDVCAVLPVDTVIDAAMEIKNYYNSSFKILSEAGSEDINNSVLIPRPGKLSVLLGPEEQKGISISAAILICHHKDSLSLMLGRAHQLLEKKAKEDYGRNSCAIELRKRGGGSRFFINKWDKSLWDSFNKVGELITDKNKQKVSMSLVYRLESFRHGIEAMLEQEKCRDLITKFIAKQITRSMVSEKDGNENSDSKIEELARRITELVITEPEKHKPTYLPERLIVAAFIADKGEITNEVV